MTDEIDLDDLDVSDAGSEDDDTAEPNEGDWLWRDDSGAEPPGVGSNGESIGDASEEGIGSDEDVGDDGSGEVEVGDDGRGEADGDGDEESGASTDSADRVPHVPRADKNSPVGVPASSGGAGGSSAFDGERNGATPPGAADASSPDSASESSAETSAASAPDSPESSAAEQPDESARSWGSSTDDETGPHGGGADDMTLALSYEAVRRLETPAAAFADAATWSDWVGIVGDVDAPVINKFQRDHGVDVDFFNGTGTGPGERLAAIGSRSMFYADRMVLVGLEDEDEPIAEAAGWEFVPLSEAAAEAGWECTV